jgi:hypothetical protein
MARTNWFDTHTDLPILDEKVHEIESFTAALADGRIDQHELDAQQKRLVAAMKAVEPTLDDGLHAKVTTLLIELTAYDIMRTLHELQAGRQQRKTGG